MTISAEFLPARRAELVIKPLGNDRQYVVKDPESREFFHLGPEEHFLLLQLDGQKTAEEVLQAFEQQFHESLTEEDLHDFIEMTQGKGFLEETGLAPIFAKASPDQTLAQPASATKPKAPSAPKPTRQSILYWRKSLFDPDGFFTWLEPKIRFCWSRSFLVVSALCILAALFTTWTSRELVVSHFISSLRWETIVWAWLTIFIVTMLHEFAHGLTCKHYGGEVHEIGFLLMFFMPCFYCNVSDAWLFREKSKRLWVSFAGGYFELFIWALAVFVWRLTVPESMLNYLAFVVLVSCGIQSLFNFNPLIKLDGYYLLSDWMEIPNLRQRSLDYTISCLRWICWGADRPAPNPRSRFLLGFGSLSWIYSLTFLGLMLVAMGHFLGQNWGVGGVLAVAVLGFVSTRGLFQGISNGEVKTMIVARRKRAFVWLMILTGLPAALFLPMEDRITGKFTIHPVQKRELVAPHEGFLTELRVREGDRVYFGECIGQLTVYGLDSKIAQKQAEIREAKANLQRLEVGSRPEEIAEHTRRVEQMEILHRLAQTQLKGWKEKLQNDLVQIDETLLERQADLYQAKRDLDRVQALHSRGATTQKELEDNETRLAIAKARWNQAAAERRAREAEGILEAKAHLAGRAKELADAQSQLRLLRAGSRPQDVAASRARLEGLEEELAELKQHRDRLVITSPISGIVTTARIHEQLGRRFIAGETICELETADQLEIVVEINEQDVRRLEVGQPVAVKLRSLPFDQFLSHVDKIAARAIENENSPRMVTVTCRLDRPDTILRPGMSGYARISSGKRPAGEILLEKILGYIRTEYWW